MWVMWPGPSTPAPGLEKDQQPQIDLKLHSEAEQEHT